MNRPLLWSAVFVLAVGGGLLFLLRDPGAEGATRAVSAAVPDLATPPVERAVERATGSVESPTGEGAVDASLPSERLGAVVPAEASTPVDEPAVDDGAFQRDAVYGRCTDDAGAPVPGARIDLYELPGGGWSWRREGTLGEALGSVEADADGRFRIAGTDPFDEYAVWVAADGHAPYRRSVHAGRELEITLHTESVVEGRVVRRGSGAAVHGARIALDQGELVDGVHRTARTVTSDADGRFRLEGLPRGRSCSFEVHHADHLPRILKVTLSEEGPTEVEFQLDPGRPADIQFVDLGTGRGVPGAELRMGDLTLGRADASGVLLLRVPADAAEAEGRFALRALADGYCDATMSVTGAELLLMDAFRIPMLAGAEVSGTVTDVEGQPIAGAYVGVAGGNRTDPLGRSPLPGIVFDEPLRPSQRTGPDGRFRIADIVPGEAPVSVFVSCSGFVRWEESVLLAQPGASAVLEAVLEPAAEVFGTVTLDGEGTAAQVQLRSDGDLDQHETNAGGEYRVRGIAAGEIELQAIAAKSFVFSGGFEPQVVRSVLPGDSMQIDLELGGGPRGTISGVLLESDGRPVPAAHVHAFSFGDGSGEFTRARTDAEGAWTLEVSLEPGREFTVGAGEGKREVSVAGVLAGATDLELRFEPRGEVRLTVVDAATQRRLDTASVRWRNAGGEEWERYGGWSGVAAPEADGAFALVLPPGVVDLRVGHETGNYLPTELLGLSIPGGAEPLEARVALERGMELNVTFVPAGELQALPGGALLLSEGEAAPEDAMELFTTARSGGAPRVLHAGEDGRAQLRAVAPGRYTLAHLHESVEFDPPEIAVTGTGSMSVEVRFTGDPAMDESSGAMFGVLQTLGNR